MIFGENANRNSNRFNNLEQPKNSCFATGVWGEIGDDPYVIEECDLRQMGASMETIFLIRKMEYVFEMSDVEDRFAEEVQYLNWASQTIAERLTKETGLSFRSVDV